MISHSIYCTTQSKLLVVVGAVFAVLQFAYSKPQTKSTNVHVNCVNVSVDIRFIINKYGTECTHVFSVMIHDYCFVVVIVFF
jgi:hypothetical protein